MLHDARTGSWPNHYLVSDMCGEELAGMLGANVCLLSHSYVLVGPVGRDRVGRVGRNRSRTRDAT